MPDPIIVVPYREEWKLEFDAVGQRIRDSLGDLAIRIDHIGSTSIRGLDAKPIVDIQVTVEALEPFHAYKEAFEGIGYIHRLTTRIKRRDILEKCQVVQERISM